MKIKSLFVIMLCLLLPLELMAGTISTCDYLAKATSPTAISPTASHHCGEKAQAQVEHSLAKTCHHCQVLCHHSLVFLSVTTPQLPELTALVPSSPPILVDSIVLDLPQRPPQIAM